MSALTPGSKVISRRFGPAIVREVSPAGIQIDSVKLGMPVRVPLDDLEPSSPSIGSVEQSPVDGVALGPSSQSSLLAAVEALRFGIVPTSEIRRVTVGFDEISDWTMSRLPHNAGGRPTFSEVCAPFGFGKSHNIETIRAVSAEAGYAVAHAEVNGQDVTFADPTKLLASLWSTLKLPRTDSFHPNWEVHVRALQRNAAGLIARTQPFERVNSNTRTVEVLKRCSLLDEYEEKIEALLAGNGDFAPTYLKTELFREISDRDDRQHLVPVSLIGRAVEDRPRHFAEALFGYAAICHWAGFKGLVVTIDEFETEHVGLSISRRQRIAWLMSVLSENLESEDKDLHVPLGIFVAAVGQGGQSGDELLSAPCSSSRGESRTLPTWEDRSLVALAKNLHELYCEAYELSIPFDRKDATSLAAKMKADDGVVQVRRFIRNYIAGRDQRYGPPRK